MAYTTTVSANNVNLNATSNSVALTLSRTGSQGAKGDSISSIVLDSNNDTIVTIVDGAGNTLSTVNLGGSALVNQLTDFGTKYLGSLATEPSGTTGALFFNTTTSELGVYNGTSWEYPAAEAATSASNASTSEASALSSKNSATSSATTAAASAVTAAQQATLAGQEKASAVVSAAAALASESSASTSASNASTSENNAASSETSAATSATSATNSATSATTAKNAAESAETNAAGSYTAAYNSATAAATSATASSASAAAALLSENAAATSATGANTALASAQTLFDNFDDTYLGAYSTDPTVDNDGDALTVGDIYFNTTTNVLKFFNGSAWEAPSASAATSASQAASSATAAAGSAATANTKANQALTSATNAATSATNAATSETNAATSATNAATSLSNIGSSETNAAASETAAATSATNASTSATNAATSATAAATSATSASGSATTAATSEGNASTSASAAATSATAAATSLSNIGSSETNAATSATNAATSASTATTQATAASTSATAAATSATNAGTSATNAATSATNTATLYDSFDDRYLGAKSSDPTVDNDGDALITGSLYFNSTAGNLRVWNGSSWVAATALDYAVMTDAEFTATAGQTTFTTTYSPNTILVFLNGVKLQDADYTATNGTSVVLATGAAVGDLLEIQKFTSAGVLTSGVVELSTDQSPELGGNLLTGSFTVDGRDVSADGTKLDGIASSANNYVHPNHSGEVTSTADGATVIASNVVDEDNLKISNTPTNGYVLTAQSGNTGGLTWAEAASGAPLYAGNENSPSAQPSATGSNAIAIGEAAVASGGKSVAIGKTATATGLRSMAFGQSYASGTDSFAAGGESSSATYGALGPNSIALGRYSQAGGQSSITSGSAADANGAYSVSLGFQNDVEGYSSNISGGRDNDITSAGSYSAIAGGRDNIITGDYSTIAGGQSNDISGTYSFAYGYNNSVTNGGAAALGGENTASAAYSLVHGRYGLSSTWGCRTHASGKFAAGGDAQGGEYVLQLATTGATPLPLTAGGASLQPVYAITAATDTCITFNGIVVAMQNGAQSYGSWEVKGLLVNDGGTTTLANSVITAISNTSNWGVALSADNTNNALLITATGEASHNIRWVANIRTVEVTFA